MSLLFLADVVTACVALPGGFTLLFGAAGGCAAGAAAAAACCRMTLDPPSARLGIAGSSSGLAALCISSHSLICRTHDAIIPPALCCHGLAPLHASCAKPCYQQDHQHCNRCKHRLMHKVFYILASRYGAFALLWMSSRMLRPSSSAISILSATNAA